MSEQPSAVPSEEAVRAAELVIQQHREAQAAARRDAMTPLLTILKSAEFTEAVKQAEALNDASLATHLRALRAGAEQLGKIGARDEAAPE